MSLFLGVAAGAAIAAPSPSSGASDIVPVIPDPLSGKEEQVTKLPNGLSVLILKDTRFPRHQPGSGIRGRLSERGHEL